jgi:hypothetical protein
MARTRTAAKPKGIRLDFSNVGKQFKAGDEYLVECTECKLEDGTKAPYFSLKLTGTEEFAGAVMYHNASTSEESLWRLRPLLEAFGIDIPDGPMDLSPEDFVGKQAMCSTYLDKYEGSARVKPDDFWPADESDSPDDDEDEDEKSSGFDLAKISDDDIKKLGAEFGLKSKTPAAIRTALAGADEDELIEACEELEIDIGGEEEEEDEPPAKATRGKPAAAKPSAKKKKTTWTEEELAEMSEEQLEAVIEAAELELDLSEFKTLRKKRGAVQDELEEAGLLEEA